MTVPAIDHLADTGRPFNRKERFFTGTVLSMLVCADNFGHFGRLTELSCEVTVQLLEARAEELEAVVSPNRGPSTRPDDHRVPPARR